ncbi:hypothetical protein KQJ29_39345, partial [Enterococcus sp. S181_ASV_20]|nr:hypothetical protein [Enterococcus sp. S181_ASV_20]
SDVYKRQSYKLSVNTGFGKISNQKYSGTLTDAGKEINWKPNLIFPGMSGKDKVNYTVSYTHLTLPTKL